MGQCESASKVEGFNTENSKTIKAAKSSLDEPHNVQSLNNFPPVSKKIIEINKKLGEFCPKESIEGKTDLLPNNSIFLGKWRVYAL